MSLPESTELAKLGRPALDRFLQSQLESLRIAYRSLPPEAKSRYPLCQLTEPLDALDRVLVVLRNQPAGSPPARPLDSLPTELDLGPGRPKLTILITPKKES